MIINRSLSNEERASLNYYLANKWGLIDTMDSDGDGVVDATDAFPMDATKSFDIPDLSDTVDAQIGEASELDVVEANMVLWLDSANMNGFNNVGIADGDQVSEWKDLSGNGHDVTQSSSGYAPVVSVENNRHYVDFVSNDFLKTNMPGGFTPLNGDSRTVIVLLSKNPQPITFTLGQVIFQHLSMVVVPEGSPCQSRKHKPVLPSVVSNPDLISAPIRYCH